MTPSLMIVAGDPSGDQHASAVVRRFREEEPDASCWGIGGPAMKREGFEPVMPFEPFNRMGFLEVALHIGFFLKAKRRLIEMMAERKPGCLLCVDYSGFNIPLMKAAHRLGIPVVWYITPMVWAWKSSRAAVLGAHAAHIATIFPFEVEHFSHYRAPVSFVGNPTVEAMEREGLFVRKPPSHPGSGPFHLAIVPGSRRQEIEHLLPIMLEAFAILRRRFPGMRATISRYEGLSEEFYKRLVGSAPVELFSGPLHRLLGQADCALVTSGTATLEAALLGLPYIIAYHTSPVTYSILKRMVRVPFVGLPNIIAEEELIPECLQDLAEPANLALTLERFLDSPRLYHKTVHRLVALRQKLGEKKPSHEVSRIVREVIGKRSDITP